jgi:hypothetical protein
MLLPTCRFSQGSEPASNLNDNNLNNVGNVGNDSPTPYYTLTLARAVPNLKAVWLYARNDQHWAEFSNVTVSLSTSATFGAGNISVCASGVTATAQAAVMRVACEGAAFDRSWQYVYVQRINSAGSNVNFGLGEIRVMSGGAYHGVVPGKDG